MKRVFEGEQIKTDFDDFDFLEIKRSSTYYMFGAPYFLVPPPLAGEDTHSNTNPASKPDYMIVNYYKRVPCTVNGILEYDEFSGFVGAAIKCIGTTIFEVIAPVEYQEFYKNGIRHLAVMVKTAGSYDISIENGTLIKEGLFYKVFGSGKYIFSDEKVLYKFG